MRRLSILLAGFTVIASLVLNRDIFLVVRWLFYFYILIYVGFYPKVALEINDLVNQNKVYRVANVPLGLALIASISSQLSFNLTQLMEMNFSMPDDLKYNHTGMVFSAQLMKAASQFEITDPRQDANIQSFVEQCIFYDVWVKKYTLKDLVTSNDLWGFLSTQKMSPVRGIIYQDKENKSTFHTCDVVFPLLSQDWKEAIKLSSIFYNARLFSSFASPTQTLQKYLPLSYGFLTKLADAQADFIMKQMMMANAIERGALHMGAKTNAEAALKSYSYVRAQSQKRLTNQTVGEMACYWLPLIKISLELILYGSFIFVVLIAVFPFGQKSLKGYLSTLIWVQLWPPVFSLFHLIISYYAQMEISSAVSGGISMQNLTSMQQLTSDIVGLAGYMSMSVPAVAGFILWGAQHSFAQLSQYIGGVTQSASSQAATELATGNISLGNTSFGNHNAFNTSKNKYDTNMQVASGTHGLQLADSTHLAHTASGHDVINMQSAISQSGIQIGLAENYRASLNKGAEHAYSTAMQNMHSFGHHVTSTARDVNNLSHHYSEMQSSGKSFTQSASSGLSHAFSEIERTNHEIQQRTGLSHSEVENLTSSLYAEGKANASFGTPNKPGGMFSASVGIGGGLSRNASNSDANTLSHNRDLAKSIMDANQYTKNVDVVARAIQDKSFRTNSEAGNRLITDASVSIDRADASRQDANVNIQKADNFRKSANFASDHAAEFRDNLSQEFIEYVASRPNQYGTGEIGTANVNQILHDPHLRTKYAESFLHDKVARLESNWQHGSPSSSHAIHEQYHHFRNQLGNDEHIEAAYKSNANLQTRKARAKDLSINKKIDDQLKHVTTNQFVDANQEVYDDKGVLHDKKLNEEAKQKEVFDHYDRNGKVKNILTGIKHPGEES